VLSVTHNKTLISIIQTSGSQPYHIWAPLLTFKKISRALHMSTVLILCSLNWDDKEKLHNCSNHCQQIYISFIMKITARGYQQKPNNTWRSKTCWAMMWIRRSLQIISHGTVLVHHRSRPPWHEKISFNMFPNLLMLAKLPSATMKYFSIVFVRYSTTNPK
jgi:hypothetical protein